MAQRRGPRARARRAPAGAASRAPAGPGPAPRPGRPRPPRRPREGSRPWRCAAAASDAPRRSQPKPVPARVDRERPPVDRDRAHHPVAVALGQHVDVRRRRAGRSNATSRWWRSRARRRSASHAVRGSPSNAAYGRCSGNCSPPGEKGARIERTPRYTATVWPAVPRPPNGLSMAASSEGVLAGGQRPAKVLLQARGDEDPAAIGVADHDLRALPSVAARPLRRSGRPRRRSRRARAARRTPPARRARPPTRRRPSARAARSTRTMRLGGRRHVVAAHLGQRHRRPDVSDGLEQPPGRAVACGRAGPAPARRARAPTARAAAARCAGCPVRVGDDRSRSEQAAGAAGARPAPAGPARRAPSTVQKASMAWRSAKGTMLRTATGRSVSGGRIESIVPPQR